MGCQLTNICVQSMLSAVLQRLYNINKERSSVVKTKLVEVCSAAYPDIQPWQVKKMCYVNEASINDSVAVTDRYYQYLSLLLNPSDGFEAARRQPPLVTVRVLVGNQRRNSYCCSFFLFFI